MPFGCSKVHDCLFYLNYVDFLNGFNSFDEGATGVFGDMIGLAPDMMIL